MGLNKLQESNKRQVYQAKFEIDAGTLKSKKYGTQGVDCCWLIIHRQRQWYFKKISVVGVDPVAIPSKKFNSECFAPIEVSDIPSY